MNNYDKISNVLKNAKNSIQEIVDTIEIDSIGNFFLKQNAMQIYHNLEVSQDNLYLKKDINVELDQEEINCVNEGRLLNAISHYYHRVNIGLKDSKEAIYAYAKMTKQKTDN